jgi:hypothetical protein
MIPMIVPSDWVGGTALYFRDFCVRVSGF